MNNICLAIILSNLLSALLSVISLGLPFGYVPLFIRHCWWPVSFCRVKSLCFSLVVKACGYLVNPMFRRPCSPQVLPLPERSDDAPSFLKTADVFMTSRLCYTASSFMSYFFLSPSWRIPVCSLK